MPDWEQKIEPHEDLRRQSEEPVPNLVIPTHNLVLAALPLADVEQIVTSARPIKLEPGDVIYEDGDKIEYVYLPTDSVISSVAILEDGSSVEISMTGREGIAGLPVMVGGGRALHWTRASVGGAALRIPARVMVELFHKNHAVNQAVLRAYRSLFTQICQRSVCNVRHTLLQRLCVWILMMQDRVGSRELPFTQEEIANKISVRRAGVSVAASMLQAMHAIAYHRGKIVITDRIALEHSSCECYRILGQEFEKWGGPSSKI